MMRLALICSLVHSSLSVHMLPLVKKVVSLNLNKGERVVDFIDGLWVEGYKAMNLKVEDY